MSNTDKKPAGWMRRWHYEGIVPKKERNEKGRWAWPKKFTFFPVTAFKIFEDDVPLYTAEDKKPEDGK